MLKRSHSDMSVIMPETASSGNSIKVLVMELSSGKISGAVFLWKIGVPTHRVIFELEKMLNEV